MFPPLFSAEKFVQAASILHACSPQFWHSEALGAAQVPADVGCAVLLLQPAMSWDAALMASACSEHPRVTEYATASLSLTAPIFSNARLIPGDFSGN